MRVLKILLIFSVSVTTGAPNPEPEARLDVRIATTTVAIGRMPAGRRLITLPQLELNFVIGAQCAPQMQAESISISVADTRHTLNATQIGALGTVATSMTIPDQQLSPISIAGFCQEIDSSAAEPGNSHLTEVVLEDALTAQVSLLCAGDAKQSITYTAQALDINLQCASADTADEGAQGASTAATER